MRVYLLLIFVLTMLAVPTPAFAAPRPAASCENVSGTFLAQAVPTLIGFDVYVVELTGSLVGQPVGSKLVTVTIQEVTPGGTIHFTGIHDFEATPFGPFITFDKGTIAANGRVQNTLTIVEGATGFLKAHGIVDLATGVIDIRYTGRVCTA